MNNQWELERIKEVVESYGSNLLYKRGDGTDNYWLSLTNDVLYIESGRVGSDFKHKRFKRELQGEMIINVFNDLKEFLEESEDEEGLEILSIPNPNKASNKIIIKDNEQGVITPEDQYKDATRVINRIKEEIDWIDGITNDQIIMLKRMVQSFEDESSNRIALKLFEDILMETKQISSLQNVIKNML